MALSAEAIPLLHCSSLSCMIFNCVASASSITHHYRICAADTAVCLYAAVWKKAAVTANADDFQISSKQRIGMAPYVFQQEKQLLFQDTHRNQSLATSKTVTPKIAAVLLVSGDLNLPDKGKLSCALNCL